MRKNMDEEQINPDVAADSETEGGNIPGSAGTSESPNIFDQLSQRTENVTVPEELNLLPLREAVFFPKMAAPIVVGREQFVKLVDDSVVGGNRIIGVVTQKDPETENPKPTDIYGTGVAVAIRMMGKNSDATRLIIEGIQRFQIIQITQEEPYMRAKVRLIDEEAQVDADDSIEIEALKRQISELFARVVDMTPDFPDE
ncbi:MAG: LON peptidase substrate-binding domain-containing protein [bacterium]